MGLRRSRVVGVAKSNNYSAIPDSTRVRLEESSINSKSITRGPNNRPEKLVLGVLLASPIFTRRREGECAPQLTQ